LQGEVIMSEPPLVWVPFHWPFSAEQVIFFLQDLVCTRKFVGHVAALCSAYELFVQCQAAEVDRKVEALSPADKAIFFASANVWWGTSPEESEEAAPAAKGTVSNGTEDAVEALPRAPSEASGVFYTNSFDM
jgi:hypothetical protein